MTCCSVALPPSMCRYSRSHYKDYTIRSVLSVVLEEVVDGAKAEVGARAQYVADEL